MEHESQSGRSAEMPLAAFRGRGQLALSLRFDLEFDAFEVEGRRRFLIFPPRRERALQNLAPRNRIRAESRAGRRSLAPRPQPPLLTAKEHHRLHRFPRAPATSREPLPLEKQRATDSQYMARVPAHRHFVPYVLSPD